MSDVRLIDANALDGHKFPAYGVTLDARERGWNECIEYLKARAKIIDAVPVVHGRWSEPIGRFQDGFWVCSCCNFCTEASAAPWLYKYCPNCGSKMDSEE
jgi:rubrerythrin